MSGGQGLDEKISEAQAMKKYAVANGVLEKRYSFKGHFHQYHGESV